MVGYRRTGRLDDVRRLGTEIAGTFDSIDGLLNNAGTFSGDYTGKRVATADGHEYSLAVNVLAPFLLTSLLLDRVRASGAGRVLVTSSISMGSGDALDDLDCEDQWCFCRGGGRGPAAAAPRFV